MKLQELFKQLGIKAGVDIDFTKPELADLATIANTVVPDNIADGLNKGLMNLEAAKSHPDINAAVRAKAFGSIDKRIKDLAEQNELTDLLDAINGQGNVPKTADNLVSLTDAINKKAEEKIKSSGKGNLKDYEDQIKKLNDDLKAEKVAKAAEVENLNKTFKEKETNMLFKQLLNSQPIKDAPEGIDDALWKQTIESQIRKAIADAKATAILNEQGELELRIPGENGEFLPYYDPKDNTQVGLNDFVAKTLATNKLVKVADPNPPAPAAGGQGNNRNPIQIPGAKPPATNLSGANENAEALANLLANSVQP